MIHIHILFWATQYTELISHSTISNWSMVWPQLRALKTVSFLPNINEYVISRLKIRCIAFNLYLYIYYNNSGDKYL